MLIQTQCRKCGCTVKLDFGDLTKEEAMAAAEKMDQSPRECPGQHMEFGGWGQLYDLNDCIHRAYDLGEGLKPQPVLSDLDYVQHLLSQGKEMVDGGCNTVPSLHLPRLHDYPDLDHLGFGNFKNREHLFVRWDSPMGTRFYEIQPLRSSRGSSLTL
jgi:hypothetical protein